MKRTVIEKNIECTPDELAKVFSYWDADKQAEFLSECMKRFREFNGCLQTAYIVDSSNMDNDDLEFVEMLAGHSVKESVSRQHWPDVRNAFVKRILESVE